MRYVIAVGGNALNEHSILDRLSSIISSLYHKGNQLIITHGNGPQVGELANIENKNLAVLTAQTQAEIGLEIERSTLRAMGNKTKIGIVLTRTLVNTDDPEFRYPSKPIGKFYTKSEANKLLKKGFTIKKLMKGYRRVVPSPRPIRILETQLIEDLLAKRYIVIAVGGGGIAIADKGNSMKYVNAVVDKDSASSLLAIKLKADRFVILTNVDGAYLNFGKRNKRLLSEIDVKDLNSYSRQGQFESGSMEPKVKACIDFVRHTWKPASIGNLSNPANAIALRNCTVIKNLP